MKLLSLQILRYVLVAGTLAAGIYSLILARASALFQEDTAVSVAAAVHLQPRNAEYLDRLASWQSDNRKQLLKRAIAENPYDSSAWIRLGLIAEMQDGDSAEAERYYRAAAKVNQMFLPRWTLANFYFRQQKPDDFFHWTKDTLAMTPYASDPVFAQMWQMSQNQDTLNAAIPDKPRILLQYAWYLTNAQQYNSIPGVVQRLVQLVSRSDAARWGRDDLLAVSLDHMLAAGYLKPALAVWSIMKKAGWLEETVPDERDPLTNGNFQLPSYRHGFDWVFLDNPGTRVEQVPDLSQVRISFYGDEPENLTLLQQYVAVAPGQHYTMTWRVQSEELVEPTGIAWHLRSMGGGGGVPEIVSGDVIGLLNWDFTAPATAKNFLLTLEYKRALGTTRLRGSLALQTVAITKK